MTGYRGVSTAILDLYFPLQYFNLEGFLTITINSGKNVVKSFFEDKTFNSYDHLFV